VLSLADVFVILVGLKASRLLQFSFTGIGIQFLELDQSDFLPKGDISFNRTHVPVTSLGRLVLQEIIPDNYEHIVYLDGDTYLAGDITPLVSHTVAAGKIAAANDSSWLSKGQLGSFWRAHASYCHELGLVDPTSYFNAGVLAFRTQTWREMAPLALEFFAKNSRLCRYHDQSALNAIFRDHREILSPIWNYQSGYAELGPSPRMTPRILHFTGASKPWRTPTSFWGKPISDEYGDFFSRYSTISPIHPQNKELGTAQMRNDTDRISPRRIVQSLRRARKRGLLGHYLANTEFAL
jgi:lipopolysaccharide biosynthesis glycosyltransferase